MTRGARHPPGTARAHPGPTGGEQEGGGGKVQPRSPRGQDGVRRGGQAGPGAGDPRMPLAPCDRSPWPCRSHPAAARGPPQPFLAGEVTETLLLNCQLEQPLG